MSEKLNIIKNNCIDMVPLCDESKEIAPKNYSKVRIPHLIPWEKLYLCIEKFEILNSKLTLGIENIEKIIDHVKNSIESDNS